ncbi:MAG: hypothetical protein ACO3EP_01535 [Phycisphaerales bacterium]|jgi:F0F1-type ATP synthase assembly protein I
MRWLPAILLGLAIVPIVGFCAVGALATLELDSWEERAPWLLVYSVLILCCLIAQVAVVRRATGPRDRD